MLKGFAGMTGTPILDDATSTSLTCTLKRLKGSWIPTATEEDLVPNCEVMGPPKLQGHSKSREVAHLKKEQEMDKKNLRGKKHRLLYKETTN